MRNALALSVLSCFVGISSLPAAIVPNGDFECHENGHARDWIATTGGSWVADGGYGGGGAVMLEPSKGIGTWESHSFQVHPQCCYVHTFKARGPAWGEFTAGTSRLNVDFPAPHDNWVGYTNIVFTSVSDSEKLHFGLWNSGGRFLFDNVELLRVVPRYRKVGDVVLGHGEVVNGKRYAFATAYNSIARNHSRPLVECRSSFNTKRWTLTGGSMVTYRHTLPGRIWHSAHVSTTCGYWHKGAAVTEVSTNGTEWTQALIVTNSSVVEADVPAKLLPANELYVRFRGIDGCAVHIYDYQMTADFKGEPVRGIGGTQYVDENTGTVLVEISPSKYFDEGYGARLSASSDAIGLWTASSGWKIPRSRSIPSNMVDGVVIHTAANEAEAVQLVVHPSVALSDVQVTCGDLKCGAARIPDKAVEVLRVGYVEVKRPTDGAGCYASWPDPLPPQIGPLPVRPNENQPFWIRVKPPVGTAKGIYRGELKVHYSVTRTHAKEISVPFCVEVFGFNLPNEMTCETAFGIEMPTVERYHKVRNTGDRQKVFDLYLKELSAHHLSPYNPAPYVKWNVRWKGLDDDPMTATPEFDWGAWDREMSRVMSSYYLNTFEIKLDGIGNGDYETVSGQCYLGFPSGTPAYEALMSRYLNGVAAHLAEKGWLSKAYLYPFDEPRPDQFAIVTNGLSILRRFAPDLRRMITAKPSEPLLSYPTIWCPPSSVLASCANSSAAMRAKARNDTFWWYICVGPQAPYAGLFIDHPGIDLRVWLWQAWQYGVSGLLVWTTTWWTSPNAYRDRLQNPYEDSMSWMASGRRMQHEAWHPWANGDGRLLYPPPSSVDKNAQGPIFDPPVSSVRIEMLRDGIEDYEYLSILKRLIATRERDLPLDEVAAHKKLLYVPDSVSKSMTSFTTSPYPIEAHRLKIARAIETLRRHIHDRTVIIAKEKKMVTDDLKAKKGTKQ